jgi:hypothetical protein
MNYLQGQSILEELLFISKMRKLHTKEKKLILCLLKKKDTSFNCPNLNEVYVEDMDDGGMGSLYIISEIKEKKNRKMLKSIAELTVKDKDGITISITLNIDHEGKLFELDIWKVDFSPLIDYPEC